MPRLQQRLSASGLFAVAGLAIVCLGLFMTWALATPRYGGPDEPGHVLRAASVADGELLGPTVDGLVSGFRAVSVPASLATGDPKCFRHDKRLPATCAVAASGKAGNVLAASSAGTNPPWYYAAVGLPVRILGDPALVMWYRVVAAAIGAVVLALTIARARPLAPAAGALVVLVAVAPATWFLFGVVNPSTLEIALALLCWVGVERLRVTTAAAGDLRRELTWIGVPAGLMILIRPVAAVAVLTMMIVVWLVRRPLRTLDLRQWLRLLVGPATGVVASVVWSAWGNVAVSDGRAASNLSLPHIFRESLTGTGDTLHELGGSLGWLEFSAPWFVQVAWWSAVVLCGLAASRAAGNGLRTAWLLTAASVVVVPVVFETALAGRIGFIWQGRYSASTAIGLVVVGSTHWSRSLRRRTAGALCALVGAAELATLWTVLRRYTVGTNGSWWFRDQRWHPGLPPFALLGVNAALFIAIVANAARWTHAVALHQPRACAGDRST